MNFNCLNTFKLIVQKCKKLIILEFSDFPIFSENYRKISINFNFPEILHPCFKDCFVISETYFDIINALKFPGPFDSTVINISLVSYVNTCTI